ncbi:MAG TPA: EamA family transporter [Thermomicrobiales bacterium]|nr:EamA family transporter [Thermomicrobiales bacterium]
MGTLAVVLVLVSAFFHAGWNVLAKRASDPLAFMFAFNLVSIVLFAIPAAVVYTRHPIPAEGLPYLLATGCVHVVYFSALAAAYSNGALSLAYPVSRGTSVLLVPLLAVPLLGERPTVVAVLGIACILAGLLTVGVLGAGRRVSTEITTGQRGLFFALLTGLTIATYSLIDKVGVSHIHPFIYVYGIFLLLTLGLAPYVLLKRRDRVLREWRYNRRAVLAGSILPMATYVIVLTAMRLSNVSYVVPLRETSIIFATLLGVLVLGERIGAARIAGSALIAAGVIAIALGG